MLVVRTSRPSQPSISFALMGTRLTVTLRCRLTDIKLVIAMHDRYALGCWSTDAYVAKYSLPTTDCSDGVPDSSVFYTNTNAIADVSN